ncbi:VP4 [Peruvian horse sickness virus]|uniref:Core protein VP4 n=1 Tax=Peruvian horse sickness virus TaxID=356862 RepID=Q2Q1E1_9REOV|nr:VP4 [Peruvian horse sickness virus]ABB72773.1 VP4 [Peruvian horse sickness virus]QNH88365.1 VP4 [Peruvian horse sickness virus]
MSTTHAVIYLAKGFGPQLKDVYLPILKLSGRESVNDLWKWVGQYNTDIYATGPLQKWSIRQLRGLGFIFVGRRGQSILTRDGTAPLDIIFPQNYPEDSTSKSFETKIGIDRVYLRKKFGDILRNYALKFAVEFHGSEAETLMVTDPKRHKVFGLPELPPALGIQTDFNAPYSDDNHTDEKLVSLLDYFVYSVDIMFYIGCGNLRTLLKFRHKDETRFNRVTWICIDPIVPESPAPNIICYPNMITHGGQLRALKKSAENFEYGLIWDVRSDRGSLSGDEWDSITRKEDELGVYIALANRDWIHMACIKFRIPTSEQSFNVYTSILVPQPSAPITMFELRNILVLDGFSTVDRSHIPKARTLEIKHVDCCSLVRNFHGNSRGRKLKKAILEYLHITRSNGLEHKGTLPRVDLFYLTNKRNREKMQEIGEVIEKSVLSTVWIGPELRSGYDDFTYPTQTLMIKYCKKEKMVIDGNGYILFLIWKGVLGDEGFKVSYDPSWAAKFGIVCLRRSAVDMVPDVSLCRFVGLRRHSTMLRLNSDQVHRRPDILKRLGLDVSGHLFVSLTVGGFCFDLLWWIKMIKEWSILPEAQKLFAIAEAHAEIVEWREENANEPWHRPEDLRAALSLISTMDMPLLRKSDYTRWMDMLR